MRCTTISIPDHLWQQLRAIAAARGVSLAAIVREALEAKAAQERPRPRSLGRGASGTHDTARRTAEERPEPRPGR